MSTKKKKPALKQFFVSYYKQVEKWVEAANTQDAIHKSGFSRNDCDPESLRVYKADSLKGFESLDEIKLYESSCQSNGTSS
jgi:hypothetical protein